MRSFIFLVVSLVSANAAAHQAPLISAGINPDAPEQVKQFGQLQGTWSCLGSGKQPDGSWKQGPAPATWTWYYVLDGYAVQDVWQPAQGPMGTNLRTYDAEEDKWQMVWATSSQARFDEFDATFADGKIVMTGDRWARAAFPAHMSRITFHNISQQHFDWSSESSAAGDGENWTENVRLSCDRVKVDH